MTPIALVRRLAMRLYRLLSGRRGDAEFDAEIREHLALLAQRYRDRGLSPQDAESAARRQFGNITLLKETRLQHQTVPWLDALWRDLRQAVRMLRKNPGFTTGVVLTLALGIGANTALFSVCNAILLAPLPYPDPDRLVMLWEQPPRGGLSSVAPANFVDWRNQTTSSIDVAAINPFPTFILSGSNREPALLTAAAVSWNFFPVLGTRMALGRNFLAQEEQRDRSRVVILSHGTWVTRFGETRDVVGSTLTLSDTDYTVIGVLPPEFELASKASDFQAHNEFDVWIPLALSDRPQRGSHPLRVFARLKPDVTLDRAQADLNIVAANLARAYPEDDKDSGIAAVPLREQVTADARPALLTLLGAVGFVLLIACANVANLILSRGTSRLNEMSLRVALGAGRARLAQQLLTESLLLALGGGALGLIGGAAAIRGMTPFLPPDLARAADIAIDVRVLIFTAAISLVTGVLFGLAPLAQTRHVTGNDALRHGTRTTRGMHARMRATLIVGQVAVTLVLLIGAGLLAKSFWTLINVAPGFRVNQVLTARLTLPRSRYGDNERIARFHGELLARLRGTPGIQAAGLTALLPLSGQDNSWSFYIEGRPSLPIGVYESAKYRPVSDGYFETIDMPVIRGRGFTSADGVAAAPVVVINEAMARKYWGHEDPVGQRLRFGGKNWRTVIGIVGDVRHEGLDRDVKPEMYVPFAQVPALETVPYVVVRAGIDAATMANTIRTAVSAIDPALAVDQIRTMEQMVSSSVGPSRFRTVLLMLFSMLALVMASIGVYGVTSYTTAQRTKEFGVYVALGATGGDVLRVVLGRATALIAAGLGVGLLASFALTRFIEQLLYGVAALDPVTFAVVPLFLFGVALLASYVPARRAMSIDPIVALRHE